eukprot:m.209420 g.209420  ORF g.209420 m.209420 type:complete len:319 (-) comp17140_c2_seq4:198-1154(-)
MRLLTIAKPAAAILGRRWQSTVQSTLTQPWLQQWFPTGITFAMAYGSGVFKQVGHVRNQNTMVDLIFAVEDPITWHEANIRANPTHYSGLASLGVEAVVKVHNLGAAKLYYNPYVTVDGMLIKYGVMSASDLLQDLDEWSSLYTSGRLHKPVHVITATDACKQAMEHNLKSAFTTACLLCPEHFDETQLFEAIASLSYSGDPRMVVGESKGKVASIVQGSFQGFRDLYSPYYDLTLNKHARNEYVTLDNVKKLPSNLLNQLRDAGWDATTIPSESVVRTALQAIVKQSAVTQSIKGVLTAGPVRAAVYAKEKLMKTFA